MDWAATDLLHTLDLGQSRGARLLTEDEHRLVDRLRSLPADVLGAYARITTRRHSVQRLVRCGDGDVLVDTGLLVPSRDPSILPLLTIDELRQLLADAGVPTRRSTRKAKLLQIATSNGLEPGPGWVDVPHRPLIDRLRRLATLRAFPDPSTPILHRLEIRRWPEYALTNGTVAWDDRDRMLEWEALAAGLVDADIPDAVAWLDDPAARAPARLDLRPHLCRRLLHLADDADDPLALQAYRAVRDHSPRRRDAATVRIALLLERLGRPSEGLDLLRRARPDVTGPTRLAVNRTGRRLARRCRSGWAPDRPPTPFGSRRLELPAADIPGPRTGFAPGVPVEQAVVAHLESAGRTAIHGEGALWRHLFAMLFAPLCYFAPVPGVLPVQYLAGPLDLGTPAFAQRRPNQVQTTRKRIQEGDAGALVRHTHEHHRDALLAGADWNRTLEQDLALVDALGPITLLAVIDPLLEHGTRRARGLPDLVVLPGPAVRLEHSVPSRLPGTAMLAELKTPNDTLSDAQRWWMHHLADIVRIERWDVVPVGEAAPLWSV